MMTWRWRSPDGWELSARQEETGIFPYGASGYLTEPPQWVITPPLLPREAAETLMRSRGGDISWVSYSMAHDAYQLSRVTVTAREARLILNGAAPLDVLLPSLTVRVLDQGELTRR